MLRASERFRILYLGTLSHLKGVLVLLSSISIVVKSRQDVEFVFAGSWYNKKDQEEAESIIANGGLHRFVSFIGVVKGQKKDIILKSSDIFVFPGIQQEGQPLVVLEAMAAGLPILFTNRGSLRETVREGENGMEILPDNPNDLAAKVLWLLDHPLKIKQMGEQSRFWFEKCYTMDHFTENMACVFNDVAKF
jgi:glycosyltransferase involved in cell wall biosynthesis